jgi:CRP/FNR family transcriptional regulator, anaerobic regulatory protein
MTAKIPEQIDKILGGFKIDKEELLAIFSHLKFIEVKKGDTFCKAGHTCDKLGILIEGLLMAKFDTDKGKLNISRFFFSPNNMLVTSFESFKNKTKTDESIVALEDSKLFYLTILDLEKLYTTAPSTNKIARHFAEESYITALQRIHDLQVLNNKERIEKFYLNQQELFNRINKIHIASYLRVNRNDLTTVIEKLNKTKKAK